MNTTTYQPLTLKAPAKGKKNKHGVVTSNLSGSPVEYNVQVSSKDNTYVVLVKGALLVDEWTRAGVIRREGRNFHLQSNGADGKPNSPHGYRESGTLASNVERVVFEYLGAVDYAQREAAKTPEEKAAEAQRIREGRNGAFNARLAKGAEALLAEIDLLVPSSTVHYAVEDARQALATLIREASKSSIQTTALTEA